MPSRVRFELPFRLSRPVLPEKNSGPIEVSGFSIHPDALPFWKKHLDKNGVRNSGIIERFGQQMIQFEDSAGIGIGVFGDAAQWIWHRAQSG